MTQLPDQSTDLAIDKDSPFRLENTSAYVQWRASKKAHIAPNLDDLIVNIADPYQLTADEKAAVVERCAQFNMAIYQLQDLADQKKSLVHALGKQFEMVNLDANLRSDEDSVSSLEVREQVGNRYIPYTNKALSWHTDGYYNRLDKQIFGIIMHCVRPAAEGGINRLMDIDAIYIALRDENPVYIEAMMHPEAMTIPANIEGGVVIREAQTGPVFMVKADGRLHMRYSARKRNIIWRDTPETAEAVAMIGQLLADDEKVAKVALSAGQGIICNNVLHNRTGFEDSEQRKRLMYRARYYDDVTLSM
jgi:hypothetical protein